MASSTWDDICTTVNGWTQKVSRRADQLTETAAQRLKLSAKRAELEEAYLKLGKLTYEQSLAESEETTAAALAAMSTVTALREEIAALEAALAEKKNA